MALVNVCNMVALDNPTNFTSPFQFEITFECLQELEDDLEWKVLYVGSAESSDHDQVLDEVMVGPVPVGLNKFVLQADAPDPSLIPKDNLVGVTVVLVTCSFREQEFVRIGYYVNNEYPLPATMNATEGQEEQAPPTLPDPLPLQDVVRTILADKPRVTRFPITWSQEQQQQQEAAAANANAMQLDTTAAMAGVNADTAMIAAVSPSSNANHTTTTTEVSSFATNVVSPPMQQQQQSMMQCE